MYHVKFYSGTAGEGKNKMITLKRMMRIAEPNEPWTIGTEDGEGWLFYFDGEIIHPGTDISYEELLERNCLNVYERSERKSWKYVKLPAGVCELEAGLAFVVEGDEDGEI